MSARKRPVVDIAIATVRVDVAEDLPFSFNLTPISFSPPLSFQYRIDDFRMATPWQVVAWFERQAKVARRVIADDRYDLMMSRLADALAVVEARQAVV